MTKTILVNKDNKVKDYYLNNIELVNEENIILEKEAYENYLELKEELLKNNFNFKVIKSFDKSDLYCDFVTGLSLLLEINIKDINLYKELLTKHGFIIRSSNNHIRYVTKFIANIINSNNLTLENYLTSFGKVVFINKDKDMTSFDVVNDISHLFGIKKVGHTGTLDPLATGVLIIAIGQATKVVELLTATNKEYIAGVKLGVLTDTLDITGEVLDEKSVNEKLNLEEVLNTFNKTYMQEVPIYSAVKVNGKKLYEYARNNIEVELPKKEVTVSNIKLINKEKDTFTFSSTVSKGCYIRSLIRDIGTSLNTYATMTSLIRTRQGKITLDMTNSIKDIKEGNLKLYDIDEVLDYPVINVEENIYNKIKNGCSLENRYNIKDKVIFKFNNKILGIYVNDNDKLKVWKNFN